MDSSSDMGSGFWLGIFNGPWFGESDGILVGNMMMRCSGNPMGV